MNNILGKERGWGGRGQALISSQEIPGVFMGQWNENFTIVMEVPVHEFA